MSLKKKIYGVLVAKKPPIRRRYADHKAKGSPPFKRAVYLFRLNFSYYILRDRSLSKYGGSKAKPYSEGAESALSFREAPEIFAERLMTFDAVSFDIFDTLIYRPFSSPHDLFHIAGAKAGLLNFAEIRRMAERDAREIKFQSQGTREITFAEIYEHLEKYCGSAYKKAEKYELEAETELCFANPYMKRVWDILRENDKRIIAVSDMYLPREFLERLLVKNGFDGFEKLFVSNEYKRSKHDGGLYKIAADYLKCQNIAHVGDNEISDVKRAAENGFTPFHAPNPNSAGNNYRPAEMSRIVGSAYGGIVNSHFHNGMNNFDPLYEYGFAYSGIFALGYCNFIHNIKLRTGADKILFLARDGDLLKRIYDKLYPEEDTEYFLWSRLTAVKLCFSENSLDFIRRFVYHKSSGKNTAGEILSEMEREDMLSGFKYGNIAINESNYRLLADYIIENKEEFAEKYKPQEIGAKIYFNKTLKGAKKALAVDVGWAGSGGNSISLLAEKWGLGAEIICVNGGVNDCWSEQPDAPEALLQSGKMYSYCFSQRHNRELYKAHDSTRGDNIFFEMLLGSESPSLKGFRENGEPIFRENEKDNPDTVRQIHKGALDFAEAYTKIFKNYPFMLEISGSDAYAPFLAAINDGGKYFRKVLGERSFNVNISGGEGASINDIIKNG